MRPCIVRSHDGTIPRELCCTSLESSLESRGCLRGGCCTHANRIRISCYGYDSSSLFTPVDGGRTDFELRTLKQYVIRPGHPEGNLEAAEKRGPLS